MSTIRAPGWPEVVTVIDSTKLSTYVECPRKFYYAYVLGWQPSYESNHLIFGQAWHEALARLIASEDYSPESVERAFTEGFLPVYRAKFPSSTDEVFWPKTPERAEAALLAWSRQWQHDPRDFEVLEIETCSTVDVNLHSSAVARPLYVKLDTVLRDSSEWVRVLEHKTCSRLGEKRWELTNQINAYLLWAYLKYGTETGLVIDEAAFLKVKGNRGGQKFGFARTPVERSALQLLAWADEANEWLTRIERDFEAYYLETPESASMRAFPRCGGTACGSFSGCPYTCLCSEWTNPRRNTASPPIGFVERHWDPRTNTGD